MKSIGTRIPYMRRLQLKLRFLFRGGAFTLLAFGYLGYNWLTSIDFNELSTSHRNLGEAGCVKGANPTALVIGYVFGVLYLFVGLAIVADDFFVPALEVIADWWELAPDVAGATLMAAGGSSPELFTNLSGTFLRSDVGFGAIVGSAVFNVLFVVGVCALSVDKPMQLDWYCICRDSSYYALVLIILAIFFGVITPGEINWWEALVLHLLYYMYVYMMKHNDALRAWAYSLCSCKGRATHPMQLDNNSLDDIEKIEFHNNSNESVNGGIGATGAGPGAAGTVGATIETVTKRRGSNPISFLKLMTSRVNAMDIASTRMELNIAANVTNAFHKYDTDNDNAIGNGELRVLCQDLGCADITDEEVAEILKQVQWEWSH